MNYLKTIKNDPVVFMYYVFCTGLLGLFIVGVCLGWWKAPPTYISTGILGMWYLVSTGYVYLLRKQ